MIGWPMLRIYTHGQGRHIKTSSGGVMTKPASKTGKVRQWGTTMLPLVRSLSLDTNARYADPVCLEHYVRVAEFLEEKVPRDLALWQAAFLHGVWDVTLLGRLTGTLHPDVIEIL